MTAYELPAGSYVAIGAYNRHGLDRQRTITIADAALAIEPATVAAPATFALARTLSVEDAIAALVNKTALNEAKVELFVQLTQALAALPFGMCSAPP